MVLNSSEILLTLLSCTSSQPFIILDAVLFHILTVLPLGVFRNGEKRFHHLFGFRDFYYWSDKLFEKTITA